MEVINIIAEFISCDPFELTENVINNNHQIKAVKMAFDRLDLAERRLKSLAKLEIMILNGRIMIR